ncbi:MAG TPA: AbrB/MazE/SpoVT family DNA-binding domain-containing protein [Pyrinomonadaceae bacterium]|nr:AbrB/MazE/SpoVT family DNA-binding domain-containing protein [Pyrinomonadaceae bacterium]
MDYKTTVTSKGTITLPSPIRKAFRITPGRKVTVSVNDKGEIVVKPGTTFEEFEKLREEIVAKIPKHRLGLTGRALKEAIANAWVDDHK